MAKSGNRPTGAEIKGDARGQFAGSEADRKNNGLTSAEPRVQSKHAQRTAPDEEEAFGRDIDDRKSVVRNEIGTTE